MEEYPGPSFVAKSKKDTETMVQWHDILHCETGKHLNNIHTRCRWWDRCFERFSSMRACAHEIQRAAGEAEHSGCEFVRMQRALYDLCPGMMHPQIREMMDAKLGEREQPHPKKAKQK